MRSKDVPVARPRLPSGATESLQRCLESGWWGYGPICATLESRFTAVHGGWALATSSCTSALHVCGRLLWRPKAEVIVPAITYVSTAMAFVEAGLTVRVADVDPISLMLTAEAIGPHLTEHTVAVVAVHLFGQRCDTEALRSLCDAHTIALVEDCAHRLDLLDVGPRRADFACYSFNAVKEAPAGEGGVLWGRDLALRTTAEASANVGLATTTWTRTRTARHIGYALQDRGLKLLLNDVSAILALNAIDEIETTRARRRRVHAAIRSAGASIPGVLPLPFMEDHSGLMCVFRVPAANRLRFREALAATGVHTAIHYPSLAQHPLLSTSACPHAACAVDEVVTVPCFVGMSLEEQTQVITALQSSAV